jgi:hypothetical protein
MSTSYSSAAEASAVSARELIEQGRSNADPISLATAEILMAIFIQLRGMAEEPKIALTGTADLASALSALAERLPPR